MSILTICIPTYNRAKYLEQTILSITDSDIFKNTSDVDIVISDNCSIDETFSVCEKFINKFPDKIKYFKNDKNIGFANFEKVLSLANGDFLKLHNDTLLFSTQALQNLIDDVKNNVEKKNLLFYLNGNMNLDSDYVECKDLNSFISNVSYYNTWIGAFGIWKEDFVNL